MPYRSALHACSLDARRARLAALGSSWFSLYVGSPVGTRRSSGVPLRRCCSRIFGKLFCLPDSNDLADWWMGNEAKGTLEESAADSLVGRAGFPDLARQFWTKNNPLART